MASTPPPGPCTYPAKPGAGLRLEWLLVPFAGHGSSAVEQLSGHSASSSRSWSAAQTPWRALWRLLQQKHKDASCRERSRTRNTGSRPILRQDAGWSSPTRATKGPLLLPGEAGTEPAGTSCPGSRGPATGPGSHPGEASHHALSSWVQTSVAQWLRQCRQQCGMPPLMAPSPIKPPPPNTRLSREQ